MIYAFEIETLSKFQDRLTSSKFVGITDDGQFAYRCKYREDGEESQVAVYIFRNNLGDIVADY
ncbi:MAG: hypothetical protein EBX57_02130 [Betaproteobacteria bacterium]|nr:hypothetical protein [Betaproteobacteria bacterium]